MDEQAPGNDQQATASHIIAGHSKAISTKSKIVIITGTSILAIVIGVVGLGIYVNGPLYASNCVNSNYKTNSKTKCIGYLQNMLNGITAHYSSLDNNGSTLPSTRLTINKTLDSATKKQLFALRKYTASTATGEQVGQEDWLLVCSWARKSYRAYTADLRPSNVQKARDAYKSAGCANLTVKPVTSDDPAVPTPTDTTSTSDSIAADTPTQGDDSSLEQTNESSQTANSVSVTSSNTSQLSITTWNIEGGNPASSASSTARTNFSNARSLGLTALASSSDIIALQESHIHDFRNLIRDKFTCAQDSCPLATVDLTNTYTKKDASKDDGSLPASLPILWNKARFQLKDYGVYTALGAGYRDADGNWVSWKWITWVKLKDLRSGKQFFVANTHTVAGVEATGQPKKTKAAQQRLKSYASHMTLLTSLVQFMQEESIPVFVVGDFNVNYRYDSSQATPYKDFPYAKLSSIGVKSSYQYTGLNGIADNMGTQGSNNRLIDYVFSDSKSNIKYEQNSVGQTRYGSDHSPVTLTMTIE